SPEKHRFTEDIIVLGVKPTNKHNTYGVYKACNDALGYNKALKSSLTNKKNTVREILKKFNKFKVTSKKALKIDAALTQIPNSCVAKGPNSLVEEEAKSQNSNTLSLNCLYVE
ncbi:16471_t:CDS:2, partial [Cetraspora pellucida]